MRALITGARGFVGRHLYEHLEAMGDDVRGIDHDDDVTDAAVVRNVVASYEPEVVYHLAALTHVGESWRRPDEYQRVNVSGTACVLDALFDVVPRATTVLVSSSEVYGVVTPDELPIDEHHPLAPTNPYARSKVDAEEVALRAWRERRQRIVIARAFNHLGPGQSTSFVVPALVQRLVEARSRGDREIAVGDLSTRRDYCDVRDVVRAYRLLAQRGGVGEVYNVASGRDVAIRDIVAFLVREVAPNVRLRVDASLLRPAEVPVTRGSFQKLHQATGWEPAIDLATSLRDVVAEVVDRRVDVKKFPDAVQ